MGPRLYDWDHFLKIAVQNFLSKRVCSCDTIDFATIFELLEHAVVWKDLLSIIFAFLFRLKVGPKQSTLIWCKNELIYYFHFSYISIRTTCTYHSILTSLYKTYMHKNPIELLTNKKWSQKLIAIKNFEIAYNPPTNKIFNCLKLDTAKYDLIIFSCHYLSI